MQLITNGQPKLQIGYAGIVKVRADKEPGGGMKLEPLLCFAFAFE